MKKDPLTQCIKWYGRLTPRLMRTMIVYANAKLKDEEDRIAKRGPWTTPRSFYDASALLRMDEFPKASAEAKLAMGQHLLNRGAMPYAPGNGKSAAIKKMAKKRGLKVVNLKIPKR